MTDIDVREHVITTITSTMTSVQTMKCSPQSVALAETGRFLIFPPVCPVLNGSILSADCLSKYINSIQQAFSAVSARVTNVCGLLGAASIVNITDGQFSNIINNSFTGTFILEFDPPSVDSSHDCVEATFLIFTKTTAVIEDIRDIIGISGCANITAEYEALLTNEQKCDNNVETRDQLGKRVHLVFLYDAVLIFTKTTAVIEDIRDIIGISGCANITAEYEALLTNEQKCDINVETRDQLGKRCSFMMLSVHLVFLYDAVLIFTKTTAVIEDIRDIIGISGCANITAEYEALLTNEQKCDINVETRDQLGKRVCCTFMVFLYDALVVCPPGTFKDVSGDCELCPLGTYNDRQGMSTCSSCPLGTWTQREGNSNSSNCEEVCRTGLYSSTRLPPCGQCPKNSYPVSSDVCKPCPTGTKYIGTLAYLNKNCLKEPCQYTKTTNMFDSTSGETYSGTVSQCRQFCEDLEGKTTVRCTGFSYHSLFQQCVLHHGDAVSLGVSTKYDHYNRTCNRLPDKECYCVLPCLAGNRSSDGFEPCTECPQNYYTHQNQSISCVECPEETLTLEIGATSNASCIDAEQILCPRCQNGSTCRIVHHGYVCYCPLGYSGRDCDDIQDFCASRPCYNGATCTSSLGAYTCSCPQGVSGDNCEVDLDDCGWEQCQNGGVCVDGLNSYTCVCLPPYYGNNCELDNSTLICVSRPCDNGGSCISVNSLWRKCVCPLGFKGRDCEVNIDECASSPCLNGGVCVDGDNSYSCICPLYQDDRCQTPRITCDSLTCGNADKCYNDYRTGLPQCLCNPGYTLEQGQSDCSLVDVCASSPCKRGGTCTNIPGGHICNCPLGYGGSLCQHDFDECGSQPCVNNGTCEDRFNNYTCQCLAGFSGDDCSTDKNECLSNPCHLAGTRVCNNTYGGFICECMDGYSGFNCSVHEDMDPCFSSPCLHGGICRGRNTSFECECRNGWMGPCCEMLVDYCADVANPCLHNASCISLQNDFFCSCPTGTYGRYCDSLPGLCTRLNPCLNLGNCTADGEIFTGCSCSDEFYGDGCQVVKDHDCASSPCLHGGTCSQDSSGHIFCSCLPGYHGDQCQYDVDECEEVICPGLGTCIDGVNKYYCRCPLGKLPPNCTEDVTVTHDVCFESPLRTASASLPFGIPMNHQYMSVSFWVKFSTKNGTGTFFSMFEQTDPGSSTGLMLLFSLAHDGLRLSVNTTEDTTSFGSYSINSGVWHLLVITWDATIGKVEVRANSIRLIQLTDYQQGKLLNKSYWITLGHEFSTASMTSVIGGGFQGCLSQVNVFSYILDTNTQVTNMMLDPFTEGDRGDILQWDEFELWGLVRRVRPSTIQDPVCTSCLSPAKKSLSLTCPKDVYLVSTLPYSPVSWSLSHHQGVLSVRTNMPSGTVLPPGRHIVIYTALDTNNNTAVCSFRIYIRENQCEFPSLVGGVAKTCRTGGFGNSYTGCSLSCPSLHHTLSQTTPLLYTCGPLGWWDSVADRTCDPTYPTCGNITSTALVNLKVRLVYSAALTTCQQVRNSLETYIRQHVTALDKHWGNTMCTQLGCTDVVLTITCSSPAPVVEIVISNIAMTLIITGGDSKSPKEIFTQALLDLDRFHFEEQIPNTNPLIGLSTVESTLICPDGHLLVDTDCVICGFGMYLNRTTQSCYHCPKGFYYDTTDGNTSCRACPDGTTTKCSAAVSLVQCHAVCESGSFFNMTAGICELCNLGTYQKESGQFQCQPCPFGQTTIQNGTSDIKLCFDMCPLGFEITHKGPCRVCEAGTYRGEGDGPMCVPCTSGITTPGNGSQTVLNCTIVICPPGYRAERNSTNCKPCELGQYQPHWNQIDCLSCPENTTTEMEAADNVTKCEVFCESGYTRVADECVPCPVGQYKNNSDGKLGHCVTCPVDYVTPTNASTSSTNCSLYNCTEGSKINGNNSGCELCPLGEYQSHKYQTNCLPCPDGSSTPQIGAIQCEVFCRSGQQLKGGQCELCPIGHFKDNTDGRFGECQPCPVDFITATDGATTEDLCVVGNCTPGQFLVNATLDCTDCPVGTYQPNKWQTACIPCPNDTTTQEEGTTQRSQCFLFCDAGYEGSNLTCNPCRVGYYKPVAGALPCSACPSAYRTQGVGATNESQCHVAACEPGTYLQNATCEQCPYGQYQIDWWQDVCVACPPQTTTYRQGAALLSDCVMDCESGFEYCPTSGQCEICDRGYYRDRNDPSQSRCQPSNCTVPGEYRDPGENRCRPCPRGQYQDQKWRDMCEMCPENYTTFTEGAVSSHQCQLACDSGYEEDNNTCVPCPVGTYRDEQDSQLCENCPLGWTTLSSAATNIDQCLPNCTRGQYYSDASNRCKMCEQGTYQGELYQRQCTQCGQGTSTRTGGTVSKHHCLYRCDKVDYCLNGGRCVLDVTQSIGCQCHFKYTGERCQSRQDVDSIAPQKWKIIVGSVVGSVAFLTIFIIVSVLIGVSYRKYIAHKVKNAHKSSDFKHQSRSFATRASLTNYGSSTGPPFNLQSSRVQKTNTFSWSPMAVELAGVNYVDVDNTPDEAIYQPQREGP
ncbi:Fibropellin-1 [Mizuhopecten yessoensis]|uniref:Fibropellin-1 n=1 Tax=Mizuhopecten yessoensis TaxID=6573 RepID=A0A210R204_MIZYE|nr:Fibropellin-1 [Mizuhopecten yessoensis]